MRFISGMKGFDLFGKLLKSFGLLEGGNTFFYRIFLPNKGKIFLFLKSSGWLSLEGFCKGNFWLWNLFWKIWFSEIFMHFWRVPIDNIEFSWELSLRILKGMVWVYFPCRYHCFRNTTVWCHGRAIPPRSWRLSLLFSTWQYLCSILPRQGIHPDRIASSIGTMVFSNSTICVQSLLYKKETLKLYSLHFSF